MGQTQSQFAILMLVSQNDCILSLSGLTFIKTYLYLNHRASDVGVQVGGWAWSMVIPPLLPTTYYRSDSGVNAVER
jgi:hypothetical protein